MSKLIYLYEDRRLRMEDYKLSDEVKSFIKLSSIDCSKEQLEDYVDRELSNASLVLFHSSYRFADKTLTVDMFNTVVLKKKIRFAVFSGGLESNLISENEATLNSDDMYRNLPFFVDSLKEGHDTLSMLVYGKNYRLNPILRLLGKFNEDFWDISDSNLLPMDRLEDFKWDSIQVILKGAFPNDYITLEKRLNEQKGHITKKSLRLTLNELLNLKMNDE